ncbi:ChaN family lipoprotein [Oricola sp.]|uniref:ChaN family lipoprotein n=1 Tax=Oricola sp. TaxID=1979950 RepID=UPI003BA8AF21
MKSAFRGLAALCLAVPLAANAGDSAPHPLVDTVWTGNGQQTGLAALFEHAMGAEYVLIGETHPNPGHHQLQAELISHLSANRTPAVVLEMVPRAFQRVLDTFNTSDAPDTAGLGKELHWEMLGWPDWVIYEPIAAVAAAAKLPLIAGGMDRRNPHADDTDKAAPVDEPQAVSYSAEQDDALIAELKLSHCNLLPEEAIAPMLGIQKTRDLTMAVAMQDNADKGGAVLVAGNGHVRTDWGVPYVLGKLTGEAETLAVGQIEVVTGLERFEDYLEDGGTSLPFDYVLFTERVEIKDPCAELAEHLGKQ